MMASVSRLAVNIAQFVLVVMMVYVSSGAQAADLSELDSARLNLSAARDAFDAAAGEYRTLIDRGSLGPTEKDDYEDYLDRLKEVIVKSCDRITELNKGLPDAPIEAGCDLVTGSLSGPVSFPEETTEDERVARLDGQLGSSMSEFDELLLREMEELKRQQSGSPDSAGGAGGGSGEGEGSGESGQQSGDQAADNGSEGDSTQQGSVGEAGEDGDRDDGQVASRQQENGQQQQGSRGSSTDSQSGSTNKTDEPPADGDDDIVARQLREAAENETDPVLREKLWEEYRRYKADTAAKTSKNNN